MTADPNTSSLGDNRLKNDINAIKSVMASTHYKTRLIVVLLCQDGEETPYDLEERVPSIRRVTGLDVKSLLVLGSQSTPLQVREFAHNLLSNVQPAAIEYYRDLSKHARRKRNRGSIPAPTGPIIAGTSQVLSTQGWNVRYEFKMGIFAEFRQEMDAAGRNYDSAYETLVGPELLDSVSLRSPRFNEMRMLADVIVIRIIRCLLWSGSSSTAVRSWLNHRNRMRDLVDRRANGTNVYGWEAWEAVWARLMAQSIEKAQVLSSANPDSLDVVLRKASGIFAYPENSKAGALSERIAPWELLHHQGYWMKNSAKHQSARRSLAHQIPEEYRSSPTNKSPLYDTYLADEPSVEFPVGGKNGFDHSAAVLNALQSSVTHFSTRQQSRAVQEIGLQMAKEYMNQSSWTEALCVLRPIWTQLSWRQEGWWQLVERLGWQLRDCAFHCRDAETIVRVDWELYSRAYLSREGWNYNFGDCLDGLEIPEPKPAVVVRAEDCVSCIELSFQFGSTEGNVGEPLEAQLTLSSLAQLKSAPIRVSEIKIVFEGSLRSIRLISDESVEGSDVAVSDINDLNLREFSVAVKEAASELLSPTGGLTSLTAMADMTMHPGQVRTWNLTCIPRESGDARVASITLLVNEEHFNLAYVVSPSLGTAAIPWRETKNGLPHSRHRGTGDDYGVAKILPKPPKVGIELQGLRNVYYTDETALLPIKLSNAEGEAVTVSLDIRLIGPAHESAHIIWRDESTENVDADGGSDRIPSQPLGQLNDQESRTYHVLITNTVLAFDYEIEVSADYHLLSDPDTPIHKSRTFDIPFIRPFEANSDITPRLDPEPWPNFFTISDDLILGEQATEDARQCHGIRQQVALLTRLVSFAIEPLIIQSVDVVALELSGNADYSTISQRVLLSSSASQGGHDWPQRPLQISPEQLHSIEHTLIFHKHRFGDREPVIIDLAVSIRWGRQNTTKEESLTTTVLPIRRHTLNISEPRVLLTRSPLVPPPIPPSPTTDSPIPKAHLIYTLENPSLHFLTFTLTMETSDTFAFSGPKHLAISLTPLSRRSVQYSLLGTRRTDSVEKRRGKKGFEEDNEGWWVRPNLVVHDTHFKKTLRVLPAGEAVAWAKGGGGVVVRME